MDERAPHRSNARRAPAAILWALLAAASAGALACGDAAEQTDPALVAGNSCDPSEENRCNGGFCLALDSGTGVCSLPCEEDEACPEGFTCQVDALLEAEVCKPGFRCADDASCPSGHRCDAALGECFIPVERGLCSPCTSDEQCPEDALCLRARGSGERFCTSPCGGDDDCPAGYGCRELTQDGVAYDGGSGDDRGPRQCVPEAGTCDAGKPLCSPCRGDDECGDGNDACVENLLTGERFCGRSCNASCGPDGRGGFVNEETGAPCDSVCPDNFACADISGAGAGPFQCVPNSGTCEGYCDGGGEAQDRIQCGFGRTCDLATHACAEAKDGRQCAPCADDDACNPPGSAGDSSCVVNRSSGESFCAVACAQEEEGADCLAALGVGFTCLDVAGQARCVPDRGTCVSGVGRLGDDCTARGADDCVAGICLHFGSRGICSGACGEDADCGDAGYRCCALQEADDGLVYDCEERPGRELGGVCAPAGGAFGDDCSPGRPPCHDGHCLDIGTARLCTAGCEEDGDCDEASGASNKFSCRQAQAVDQSGRPTDEVKVCFPAGGGELGSDCSFGPAACADRLCIKKESGNVCTKECEADSGGGCPSGWECGDAKTVDEKDVQVCLPPAVQGG